jgi:ribonuclease P protein component
LVVDILGVYMLNKRLRLHKTKDIDRVFKGGRVFHSPYFFIKTLKTREAGPRATVVVSTKVDKRAVKRNRLKRIVRVLLGKFLTQANLPPIDYIIILKPLAGKVSENLIVEAMDSWFSKNIYAGIKDSRQNSR